MQKHWYAIYGSIESELQSIAYKISKIFECEFQDRNSSYIGNYLKTNLKLSRDNTPSEIKIRRNSDPQFGGLEEPEFPEYRTLIYVSRIANINNFELKIKTLELKQISLREI